jgi:hypothetical protein
LSVEVAAGTDVGCVRANNEDGCDRRQGIYVVCEAGVDGCRGDRPLDRVYIVLEYFDRPRKSNNCLGSGKHWRYWGTKRSNILLGTILMLMTYRKRSGALT